MGLMKKLTSALVASSLVLGLVGTALAAPTQAETNAAYERLKHFGVVEGVLMPDGSVSPALDMTLTRAQLVTIIVRAFGEGEAARILQGAATFSDVPGEHWASGYVAVAKNIASRHNIQVGYPDGTFQPERTVTAIEALAFVMKFLGVPVPSGDNWVQGTIASAQSAGVLSADDVAKYLSDPGAPATRGLAFALADSIFYNYVTADGTTVYRKHHDSEPPTVTLAPLPSNTSSSSITISGKVSGDFDKVYVGSDLVTVGADGSFAAVVNLNPGANEIEISARDLAGNVATEKVTVTRGSGVASKIVVTLPDRNVKAGSAVDLDVRILDDAGVDTGIQDFTVTLSEDLGTYADGKFIAGGKLGRGTITVSYGDLTPASVSVTIVAGDIATVESETPSVAPRESVKLIAKDEFGNVVSGATFSEDHADAFLEGDRFLATKPGRYTVTATKDGKSATGTISVFGEHAGFTFEAPQGLVANESTEYTILVHAVDEDGNRVTTFSGLVSLEANLDIVGDASVEAKDGVAAFKVLVPYGMDGLDAEFTAYYSDGDKEISSSGSIRIQSQVAAALDIEAPKYLAINYPDFKGTLRILDQAGNPIEYGDGYPVTLTISGPGYFEGTSSKELVLDIGGTTTFEIEPVDRFTEGTITIRATSPGLKTATATVEARYAMAPRSLKIAPITEKAVAADEDEAYEFELTLEDRNGVPTVADEDYDVTLTFDGTGVSNKLTVLDDRDDVLGWNGNKVTVPLAEGEGRIRIKVLSNATGTFKVTAAAQGLVSATGTVAFAAGDPDRLEFGSDEYGLLAGTEYVITAQLKDANENPVAKSGVKVEFSLDRPQYALLNGANKAYTTTTDAEGRASVRVRLLQYVETFELTASAEVNGLELTDSVTLRVVPSVPRSFSITTWTSAGQRTTISAGEEVEVRVTVTDNNGLKWSGDAFASRLVLEGIDPDYVDGDTDFYWNGEYYVASFRILKAGNYTLKVTDRTALNVTPGSRPIRVVGGEAHHVDYLESDFTYKKNDPKELIISAVDIDGNKASKGFSSDRDFVVTITAVEGGKRRAEVRATRDGYGDSEMEFTMRQSATSLRIYFVTDADAVEITIDGGDPIRFEARN